MKINPKYGDKIISIPGTPVLEYLPFATCEELRVLIYALANQNAQIEDYEKGTGVPREKVAEALKLWRKKDVMTCLGLKKSGFEKTKAKNGKDIENESENKSEQKSENKAESRADSNTDTDTDTNTKKERAVASKQSENGALCDGAAAKTRALVPSELPLYSSEHINRILEKNRETKSLIDNCQQSLGKIFSIHEVEVILKLKDYLGLDEDFILLLCSHCSKINKTSLRYVEKKATALFDMGITEYAQLEKHLEDLDAAAGLEGKFRKLLGVGERSLTKKEKDALLRWTTLGLSWELIEKAFEVTVDNARKFSLNYMSAVLESWYKDGLLSAKAVSDEGEKQRSQKKSAAKREKKGSFDEDDFFEEALKRSYDS